MRHHHICWELMGYKSYPPSIGLARQIQHGYDDSNYGLKSAHWCTRRLWACEIPPIHNVILSHDFLWLVSYVSGQLRSPYFLKKYSLSLSLSLTHIKACKLDEIPYEESSHGWKFLESISFEYQQKDRAKRLWM